MVAKTERRDFFMRIIEFFKQLVFKLKAKRQGLYYMNGTEGLPLPLTEQEEGECLKRLAAGDEQVKQKLIERNLRLVVYIARKFDNTGIDLDDLISIGSIGLIKAINSYNVEKKIKLATFASRCIENEILMYLRRTQKTKGEVSFDEPLNVDGEGNELVLGDILGTDADVVSKGLEKQSEKRLLFEALESLNKKEKLIMNLRFGLSGNAALTQKEVASVMGISQSYISRLEKKIVKKLKKDILKAQEE